MESGHTSVWHVENPCMQPAKDKHLQLNTEEHKSMAVPSSCAKD
jgi:hypothetical protein